MKYASPGLRIAFFEKSPKFTDLPFFCTVFTMIFTAEKKQNYMKKSSEMKFAARKVLLAKMKLPDHAQLLVKFLSKNMFKNFENF